MLAGAILMSVALPACVEDKLVMDGENSNELYQIEESQYGMGVVLSLDKFTGSTRALEDIGTNGLAEIEEYVDTDNLFILFFDIHGTYLFQISNPTAIPMGQSATGMDNQWFVKLPVTEINPNLIKFIEENPFKIAVLANWTFKASPNLGPDLSGWEEFRFHEPLDEQGNIIYDEKGNVAGDNISQLAHAQKDIMYEYQENHGYDHLFMEINGDAHMGPYTEWVANYHSSIAEADSDIRNNFDVENNKYSNPDSKYASDINHFKISYNNLWHLWNFGGNNSANFAFPAGEDQKNAWLKVNQSAKDNFASPDNSPQVWKMKNYTDLTVNTGAQYDGSAIILTDENISATQSDGGEPIKFDRQYIHFKAYADGYVNVNYKSEGGARLVVHFGANETPESNSNNYKDTNIRRRTSHESGEAFFEDVSYDPENVYIYMVKGSNPTGETPKISIYGIEFIESRHLYDVDRRGILPTKDYPIPMYGIQDFDPIGEYWEPGLLFNLSQYNHAKKEGYNYRTVSLLRSLARVEVKLSKAAFPKKPSHVYLRSLNRSARTTPVDFFTPTDIVWNGFNPLSKSDAQRLQNYTESDELNEQAVLISTPGHKKEWDNIYQYGPFYVGNSFIDTGTKEERVTEFRKTTSWPYGVWEKQWNWDWNRTSENVGYYDTYKVGDSRAHTGQTVPEYPRIHHPRISRSDYARFTEVNDPNGYWHYVIYAAEKNITDADNPGNTADRPKIIHIELRFNGGMSNDNADENLVDNFDDNAAYRLYFTEGGMAQSSSFTYTGRSSWDNYERDWNIARQHWPIIRNHAYIFTVTGGLGNTGSVNLQVNTPAPREVTWDFD